MKISFSSLSCVKCQSMINPLSKQLRLRAAFSANIAETLNDLSECLGLVRFAAWHQGGMLEKDAYWFDRTVSLSECVIVRINHSVLDNFVVSHTLAPTARAAWASFLV